MMGRGEVARVEEQADEAADGDGQRYRAVTAGSGAPFASLCARMAVRQERTAAEAEAPGRATVLLVPSCGKGKAAGRSADRLRCAPVPGARVTG
ncbi:hypothetical protein HS99_0009290 [Kitasatospora aureofaciens]|uniref:Uncharacterized protein n=1 Tax=Kitasatospora aureofaciens TaxID=1894 RepID=A0A1E7N1W3_KITAU|nr:hypothetical protein B6264_26490 [Kitasatospora aureofaciens]OEV34674.1 hypothetical protein HS99_0009290 [Kitasatospora aureofaciens]